ncbi:hypothetical protein Caci_2961 [Catenulispora acidiphila DSM 44928]|uniref:Uncharacterized protein n=1 Tax=Catenulispora acidiphila (strain DSM 44928 / JCM 14897 / NBRC 102108 / NRRL B-24433 / ID139908) TaxID=479433 RepID=C7Q2X8_CATAD|nr:hypothetical protein [Catenulispora acidiphila]ACU71870.1 hypothetical protein Caci_2961 [Catenulispora acidiphila DSM 44928]
MNDRPTPERLAEIRSIHEVNWAHPTLGLVTSMERVMCNDLLNEVDALIRERDERPTVVVQFDGPLNEAGYQKLAERWREIVEQDKGKPLQILAPDRTDYGRFEMYYDSDIMACLDCYAFTAPTNVNLADYVAWADGHRCEVRT